MTTTQKYIIIKKASTKKERKGLWGGKKSWEGDKKERERVVCINVYVYKGWGPIGWDGDWWGTHSRNNAHDLTSDGCQLPPKKRGVGSVWDRDMLPSSIYDLLSKLRSPLFLNNCKPNFNYYYYYNSIHIRKNIYYTWFVSTN